MTDPTSEPGRAAPHGARANAVPPPPAWVPLAEVDPRVAPALLECLEDVGIAAYAEPGPGTERLHVDATRQSLAEAVVSSELPGLLADVSGAVDERPPDPVDDDAAFAAIVAGWEATTDAPVPPWPVVEDVVPGAAAPPAPAAPPRRRYGDVEHYVPPPPPPGPRPTGSRLLGVFGICLGLFLLVGLPLLGTQPSNATYVLGLVGIVGGLGTLVWTMRDGPPVDDGPDDGAVL